MTTQRDIIRSLSSNRSFAGLDEDDFAPFLEQTETLSLDKGEHFVKAGEKLMWSYILISGCVEMVEEPVPGKKFSRQHFASGTIFAGGAFIKSWPQTRDHTTTEKTLLLRINRTAFQTLLNAGNNVAFRILDDLLDVFVEEVRSANQHLDDLYSHPDETLSKLRSLQG